MDSRGRMLLNRGERLAGYEIDGPIAESAEAVVHRAHDVARGRRVALKVLAPQPDPALRERFIRESRSATALDHPNVVPVLEAGQAGGLVFAAMPYLEAGDLGSVLAARGPLAPGQAVAMAAQVASALDAAHARGLVHRHLRAGDVLIAGSGYQLADFGHPAGPAGASPSVDVRGLAGVLHHALTGVEPGAGPLRPASQLRPGLPPALDAVLARATAPGAGPGPATCGELVAQARAALGDPAAARVAPRLPAARRPGPEAGPAPTPTSGRPAGPGFASPPASGPPPAFGPMPAFGLPAGPGGDPADDPSEALRVVVPARAGGRGRLRPLLAGLVVVALAVAGAVFLPALLRPDYVGYRGDREPAGWISFDRPREWAVPGPTAAGGTCFCTAAYGGLFEKADRRRLPAGDGVAGVEGLYVRQVAGAPDLAGPDDVRAALAGLLTGADRIGTPVTAQLSGRTVWRTDVVLVVPGSGRAITARWFVGTNTTSSRTEHLVLFAGPGDPARLDRVQRSIGFLGQG